MLNFCTLLIKRGIRYINTFGEGCRFLRLIALKGWRWVKEKSKDIVEFSEILNNYVFVKNAKV